MILLLIFTILIVVIDVLTLTLKLTLRLEDPDKEEELSVRVFTITYKNLIWQLLFRICSDSAVAGIQRGMLHPLNDNLLYTTYIFKLRVGKKKSKYILQYSMRMCM